MKAVVTGVSGQDGYYMLKKLLAEGFEVIGLTSNIAHAKTQITADLVGRFQLIDFNYELTGEFSKVVDEYQPDFVFNFAAKATGQGMFDTPHEINRLNGGFIVDILEALRSSSKHNEIVFCQASSSEMYGDVSESPQTEHTPFRPKSPYGAAKLYAHNMLTIYRSIYGIKCCSAILYNHESVRRSTQFVTKKIANAAARIKLGQIETVMLGSLDSVRDWGYAPEYVEAMYRMARSEKMDDYVVASGRLSTVRDLCEAAFGCLGMNYVEFVQSQSGQFRVSESFNLHGNPEKIKAKLGWDAKKSVREIMIELVEYEMKRLSE